MSGQIPRIFVGTLSCGEAELAECCAAIGGQRDVAVTHHIIENLPEHAAHAALWRAWGERRDAHDLFVKIDADTVLNRPTALAEIYSLFHDADVTGAQIPLHDYFTDAPINGLNAFSPVVQFRDSRRKLYADHADYGHKKVLKGATVAELAPIGWHGRDPAPKQAFHFGFHRALKGQTDTISRLIDTWRRIGGTGREWAIAGAASARWWMRWGVADYHSKRYNAAFEACTDHNARAARIAAFIDHHRRKTI